MDQSKPANPNKILWNYSGRKNLDYLKPGDIIGIERGRQIIIGVFINQYYSDNANHVVRFYEPFVDSEGIKMYTTYIWSKFNLSHRVVKVGIESVKMQFREKVREYIKKERQKIRHDY